MYIMEKKEKQKKQIGINSCAQASAFVQGLISVFAIFYLG
jgi:hypothetical protein